MKRALILLRDKAVDVRPNEWGAMWLAFLFNFVILAGYYILRPIREEIGASSGVENLPWMYTATLVGMLIANTRSEEQRLNSSHTVISYAVFCLKKKKYKCGYHSNVKNL